MTITDVLQKHFGHDDKTFYFSSSDALRNIEGDTYLTYCIKAEKVQLWFGGNNGEVCILCTDDAERLDQLIKAIKAY